MTSSSDRYSALNPIRSPDRNANVERILKAALIGAIVVGLGGFLGTLARYGLSGWVHRHLPLTTFPYATLMVNLLGCLVIGVIAGLVDFRKLFGPGFREIGILGGFTTFSTFGYETFLMIRDNEYLRAAANVGMHVILGVALVWLGYSLSTSR